jgi:tetratricopeptide (TPR) repeat protein
MVLSWNFGEWAAELPPLRPAGRALSAALGCGLALWVGALLADRYYVHTGEPRHFAFREEPLAFAHEAVAFAGQPGLPDRALVYGLGQTGLYVWHNSPRCKPFMDGRLEMPDEATFRTYVRVEDGLRTGDPGWEPAVAAMGNPLLLLEHQDNYDAEARLLTHPGWRCVYYDALASVYVRRDAAAAFPTVDFARRHFDGPATAPVPAVRGAAAREQKALFNLAASLPPTPAAAWRWRVPILYGALDRSRPALDEEPDRPETWVTLGNCHWRLDPDLRVPPPTPADGWSLERNVYLAQATWCYRRATERRPDNPAAWRYLAQSYQVRGMTDAQAEAEERWQADDPKATNADREQAELLRARLASEPSPAPPASAGELQAVVVGLVQRHRPAAAARLLDESGGRGGAAWPWALADQAAVIYLHLGRPADARRALEQAADCPAPAQRECRVAATFWVERDPGAALAHFEAARAADPRSAEACWGLAMLHAQLGNLAPAREACRAGRGLPLTNRQRADLEALERLLMSCQANSDS